MGGGWPSLTAVVEHVAHLRLRHLHLLERQPLLLVVPLRLGLVDQPLLLGARLFELGDVVAGEDPRKLLGREGGGEGRGLEGERGEWGG